MKIEEILKGGDVILQNDIRSFKSYYLDHKNIIDEGKDLDSSIDFEIQYLNYLMYVENNYTASIQHAQSLLVLPNITQYTIAKVYRVIGVAYFHTGDYSNSIESYLKAVRILDNMPNKSNDQWYDLAILFQNISLLYSNKDEKKKREDYLFKAKNILQEINSEKGLSIVTNSIANYYYSIEKKALSYRYLLKSLSYKEKLDDKKGVAVILGNIATIYIDYKRFDEAESILNKSLALKEIAGNDYSICHTYMQFGAFYKSRSIYNKAKEKFTKALDIAQKYNMYQEQRNCFVNLCDISELEGDFKGALSLYKNLTELDVTIHTINKNKELQEQKHTFEVEKKEHENSILKKKNEEIEAYLIQLKKANFEMKQFAQIASHDLKEPARLVRMYAEVLERNTDQPNDSQRIAIDFLKTSSENLVQKINALYKYTNIDNSATTLEKVNVVHEINSIKKQLANQFPDNTYSIHLIDIPEFILTYRSQLHQILFQLIENALLFNENEAKILYISYSKTENYHNISIKDNGIGIDEAYYYRIFEMFERLHSDDTFRGTGIGLAIVKKLITDLNGFIEVESKLGQGSTFKLFIPIE